MAKKISPWAILPSLCFLFCLFHSTGCFGAEPNKPELVSNADLQKIDSYGLPEGFKYVFEADKDGVKPDVEITTETDASGRRALKISSRNGKGRVFVLPPANLSAQPKTGKRYFLIRWQAKTSGEAQVYLDIDRRARSQSMQSQRWINAVVPIEPLFAVGEFSLVFAGRKPGDAVWINSVSVSSLNQSEYRRCFINAKWPMIPDEKVTELPQTTRAGKAGNILANSSFELGPYSGRQIMRGFRQRGNTDKGLGSQQSYDGQYCCQAVRFESIYYPFQPDKLYTVSVYARAVKPGAILRLGVRSGCQEVLQRWSNPWNPNAAEAQMTFPLTTEWQRCHFSFVTAPDPDPDYLKPVKPRNADASEIRLMFLMGDAIGSHQMDPKSAFKIIMEGEDLQGNDTAVWVDALQLEQGPLSSYRPEKPNTAGVVLERSDTNDFSYYDDQPLKITGKVFTENTTPRNLLLTYSVTDFFGRELKKIERRVDTQGKHNVDDEFPLMPPGRGLQAITLTVSDPAGRVKPSTSMQQAFGVCSSLPRSWPFDEKSGYGIQSQMLRATQAAFWADEYERMRKIGVKWFHSFDIWDWNFAEPEKGKWQWADAALTDPAQQDFMMLGYFRGLPGWLGGGSGYHTIDQVDGHWPEWEEYVYQVVNHYKDRIKYWEIWSEAHRYPDIYAKLLKTASDAARRADPSARIVGVGETHPGTPGSFNKPPDGRSASYKGFVEGVLDKAGLVSMDAMSVHGYLVGRPEENWWPMSQRLEYLRGEMKKRGKILPIWDTESAAPTGLFYTDRIDGADNFWNRETGGPDPNIALLSLQMDSRTAANWMAQTLAVYRAHGCEKFFYHFNACSGWSMDGNAGVLYEYDDSPKSTYAAWAGIILMLDRSRFVKEVNWGKDARCYVYQRDGIPTAAFWRLLVKENVPPGALTFNAPAGQLEFLDLMTNPLDGVKTQGSIITAPLTSDLAYVQGKGMDTGKFISILEKAGRSDKPQELIDGSSLFQPEARAASAPAVARREGPILDCHRVRRITLDGKPDDWQEAEPFKIRGPDQVVVGRPDPNVPANLQQCWQNDDDLSAGLWVGWDEDNLYWAVLVRDDVLVENPNRGKPLAYNGDCLEVFLDGREEAGRSVPQYDRLVGQRLVTPATSIHPSATLSPVGDNILAGMEAVSSVTGNGYFVEGRVPIRRFLPEGLTKGRKLGFDLAIDDTDSGANFKTHMNWSGKKDAYRDATVFVRLRLAD